MIVVDASVAVKWFLPEPGSEAAEALLTGPEKLVAPDLIRIEVAAAITRRVRLGELAEDEAGRGCAAWLEALGQGVVTLISSERSLEGAIGLALRIRHALQDCLYLAVAQDLQAPLITGDARLHARARAVWPATRLLAGLPEA